MGLAGRRMTGVADVVMRFVKDPQAFGLESRGQLLCDQIGS